MEARAKRKYLRISPRKMRIVADVVRGKNAQQAITTLEFMPQKAAAMVRRAIQDAYGNLIDQNQDERIDDDAFEGLGMGDGLLIPGDRDDRKLALQHLDECGHRRVARGQALLFDLL